MLNKMRRYLGIGVAWLGATILSVAIASTAVAGIRDRVVEAPVALGAPTTTTTVVEQTASSTTFAPPSTTAAPPTTNSATTTTEPPATETTVAESEPTTTTTTAAPATTTTTTTTEAPEVAYQTYSLVGGTVTLAVESGTVVVASAVANPGFQAEVEKSGPTEVKVEFESNDHKSELTASFEDGELRVRTHEEDEDDEHDGDD